MNRAITRVSHLFKIIVDTSLIIFSKSNSKNILLNMKIEYKHYKYLISFAVAKLHPNYKIARQKQAYLHIENTPAS